MTKVVPLLPEHEIFAERLVEAGRYGSVSEVVMEAFEHLKNAEAARGTRDSDVGAKLAEGVADTDAGRTHEAGDVFAELDAIICSHDRTRDAAE